MREDQRKRLLELQEQVTDEALNALDPRLWPGASVPVENWDAKIRGDRNWMLKNANAAVSLLVNLKRLTDEAPTTPPVDEAAEEQLLVEQAEAQARALLDKAGKAGGRPHRAKN